MTISVISDDLIRAGQRLLAAALDRGADEAEVYGLSGRTVDVDLRGCQINLASQSYNRGLGLRAVVSGGVGFSSTSDLSRLEETADFAVRAGRARGIDRDWHGLPGPSSPGPVDGIFDPAIEAMSPEDCMDSALELIAGCSLVSDVQPVSGGVACHSGWEFILNSNGLELSESGTSFHAALEAVAKRAASLEVSTGFEFSASRSKGLGLQEIGRAAANMAYSSLSGGRAESGVSEVLLRPVAAAELFSYTFVPALNADSVSKGRSTLAGKVGEQIASEHIDIVDNGLLSGGMGSSAFDGEGVPCRRNVLVEGGVLRGFQYDCYTAAKAGVVSNGSSVRAGYSSLPEIGAHNMIMCSKDAIDPLRETARGFLVNGLIGAHTANPISGDFSVEARNSFVVVDGEQAGPVKSMMLAGNIFQALKDMQCGTDARAVGSMIVPTVRLKIKVIG